MSTVIEFRPRQPQNSEKQESATEEYAKFSALIETAALVSDAKSRLRRLTHHLEAAMECARTAEAHMQEPTARKSFGTQLKILQCLLDLVREKIAQL